MPENNKDERNLLEIVVLLLLLMLIRQFCSASSVWQLRHFYIL